MLFRSDQRNRPLPLLGSYVSVTLYNVETGRITCKSVAEGATAGARHPSSCIFCLAIQPERRPLHRRRKAQGSHVLVPHQDACRPLSGVLVACGEGAVCDCRLFSKPANGSLLQRGIQLLGCHEKLKPTLIVFFADHVRPNVHVALNVRRGVRRHGIKPTAMPGDNLS